MELLTKSGTYTPYEHDSESISYLEVYRLSEDEEKEIEERQRQIDNEIEQRKKRQEERKEERALLRFELSHEESFVLDLLDILDQEEVKYDAPRLEELANLAPEIFTRNVIDHLLNSIFTEQLPYSIHAARALLKAALEPNEKAMVLSTSLPVIRLRKPEEYEKKEEKKTNTVKKNNIQKK